MILRYNIIGSSFFKAFLHFLLLGFQSDSLHLLVRLSGWQSSQIKTTELVYSVVSAFLPFGHELFSASLPPPSFSLFLAVLLYLCLSPLLSTLSSPFSLGSSFHGDAIYCHIKCRGHCAHVHVCLSHQKYSLLESVMKIPFITPHRNR